MMSAIVEGPLFRAGSRQHRGGGHAYERTLVLGFLHDTLASKRRIRALTIVDDFTHESLAIEVDTALSG